MKSKIKPMTPGVPHSARIRAYLAGAVITAGLCGVAWRAYALQVRQEALDAFYAENPKVKEKADEAAGTYFMSGFAMHPGLLTFANGYGIVENHRTKEIKFTRQVRFGIGPGISIKGNYLLVLVHDEELLKHFVYGRWEQGAFAEASFVFGDFGGSAVAEGTFTGKVDAYMWTHTGLGLELTLAGAHIGGDEELNEE